MKSQLELELCDGLQWNRKLSPNRKKTLTLREYGWVKINIKSGGPVVRWAVHMSSQNRCTWFFKSLSDHVTTDSSFTGVSCSMSVLPVPVAANTDVFILMKYHHVYLVYKSYQTSIFTFTFFHRLWGKPVCWPLTLGCGTASFRWDGTHGKLLVLTWWTRSCFNGEKTMTMKRKKINKRHDRQTERSQNETEIK